MILKPISVLATLCLGVCTMASQVPLVNPVDKVFSAPPRLVEVLTIQNKASIFFTYARDTVLGELLYDEEAVNTVFAPTNNAIMALARKPNQGPADVDVSSLSEEQFDKESRGNVERWIRGHIVPGRISEFSSNSYDTLLGTVITVSSKEGHKESSDWSDVVLNSNISIVSKHQASNGVLYLIDGAISS